VFTINVRINACAGFTFFSNPNLVSGQRQSKIRNSNTETNPNIKDPKPQTKRDLEKVLLVSLISQFSIFLEFVSDFDIRIFEIVREFPSHHSLVTDH
jgi:hypothetical protein